jgi:hypothetical protein
VTAFGAAATRLAAVFAGEVATAVGAFPGETIKVRQDFILEEAFALDADAVASTALRTNWFHVSGPLFSNLWMPKQCTG